MTPSQLRRRYRLIITFFARAIASFIVWETILPRLGLSMLTRRTRPARNRRVAIAFRNMAIKRGGLMIKVGQALSARLDILPEEITHELAGLQDEVPAETFSHVRSLAEAELGGSLESLFASFEEAPLAAASLGQVHRARLHPEDAAQTGFAEVVVKVQRPNIEQIVSTDLTALRRVARWLQLYRPIADRADVPAIVEEFASTTAEEIDYVTEGRHAEVFASIFEEDARVYIPQVAWERTTRRVLTLEDVSAIKITDYDAITAAGIDRGHVAEVLLDTYFQQIFEDGFFHADPHPGNLFVAPLDGRGEDGEVRWCLTFVDFGMVGRMPDNLREGLREMLIAIGTQDAARLVRSYQTLGVLLPGADTARLESASMQVFERFWGMSMNELKNVDHADFARLGPQFREVLLEMPFQLPENLLLLGRTVALLSGMCTGLNAEFNVWAQIAPYASEMIADEGGSQLEMLLTEGQRVLQTAIGLPGKADRVLTAADRGQLAVRNPGLELRVRRVERAVGRVSGAIVFAALLIAGAILFPHNAILAQWLMGASAVPLLWALLGGRGGHPLG
jgi:predicted unusual protein kinase regulating ubiquinone biosynthesis (AarF/ABC1/UbiB family)